MIIVKFKGGLGNQMFQYALYKKYMQLGKETYAEISFYDDRKVMPLKLEEAFQGIKLNTNMAAEYAMQLNQKADNRNILEKICQKVYPYKKNVQEISEGKFDSNVLKLSNCFVEGFWQTEMYWDDIKEEVLQDFKFNLGNTSLSSINRFMKKNSFISIHIRGGDYLNEENQKLFGGVCSSAYYKSAIDYVQNKTGISSLLVFTNDCEYSQSILQTIKCDYYFAKNYLNEGTPDWVEMYLMSQCKHNIIANSSFSWWGAYLNRNSDKIIVAPQKWINGKTMKNICPNEWIRIERSI